MPPRRTIEELSARFLLEPQVRDVFVEGHLDQTLVLRYLRQSGRVDGQVYRVEHVEVPREIVLSSERGSERGRLHALAAELEHRSGESAPARCIVDRDLDALASEESLVRSNLVIQTDFSTMEMYFFDEELINELCSDFLRMRGLDVACVLREIGTTLRHASLMFGANVTLGLRCSYIDIARCCEYSSDTGLTFDHGEYMQRYLQKGSAWSERDAFMLEIDRLSQGAPNDFRVWVRGKSFLPLLGFVLRSCRARRELCTPRSLEGVLTTIAGAGYLSQFSLFDDIGRWHDSR